MAELPTGMIPDPPAPDPPPTAGPGGPVLVAPVQPVPGPEASEATGLRLVCVPPARVKMINGASATLEVITERAKNALVLPVEAVAGSQGRGQVEVVRPDGTREIREVRLGLTDGKVIQIRSGLAEGEIVAVPGPNIPAAPPDPGNGDGRVTLR